MTLFSLLLLLAPLLAAIMIIRPSWPEFFLLVLPLIGAIAAAFFALRVATFLGLGLIGLLIGLSTINIDAEERGVINGPITEGLFHRLLRARDNITPSERARREHSLLAQGRPLTLARLIAAECVVLSFISVFMLA